MVCVISCSWLGVWVLIVLMMVDFLGVLGILILLRLVSLFFIELSVFCSDLWKLWLMVIILFMDFIVVVNFGLLFGNFLKVKCGILVII